MMNKLQFHCLPPHQPFLETLAAMLLEKHSENPLDLARTLILLPSRRSCRSLREAFLRVSAGKPLLLPRIMPIGEVDAEADIFTFIGENLPPIMPTTKRLAMLTRLILQQGQNSPARAYQLAVELARLLDEVTKYGLSFEKLHDLAPLELAAHWQKTTEFLAIITRQWPHILEAEHMKNEASVMRERVLQLAETWRKTPPDFPVIAAGSTGSQPATAALLQTIATMPNGTVFLPGLDSNISDNAWDALEPTHPQWGLKKLLSVIPASERGSRETIPAPEFFSRPPHKAGMTNIFSPAALTADWREEELNLERDFAHISLMQADTQNDEARMIAYKLREALETPAKTAALITPDRTLARMVAAQCARWGITIDDSAGQPLADSPPAVFMRLLLEVSASGAAPLPLLALLRHPFAAAGIGAASAREFSRTLEKDCLRGVRLQSGMDALVEEVKEKSTSPELLPFITHFRDILRPLEMLFLRNAPCPLAELIEAHCTAAELLATTNEKSGAEILWEKESGEALANLLTEWKLHADVLGNIAPQDYPALFDSLIAREVTRSTFGSHPRLHILSPIEARLLHFDLVILGEMNEGTWPASITIDPWMSAPMRETFGLPPHSVQIGQSAHDVWMLMHAPHVIFSRARKISGSPQKPSRWWVRLITLVGGKDPALLARMDISSAMQATILTQDAAHDIAPLTRPKPVPPHAARPRKFSPSSIDVWSRDAYAFYAKTILRLKALNDLDEEPDNREFGQLIHSALEHFSAEFPAALPDHAYQLLIAQGQHEFQPYMHRTAVATLWWPRFEAIAKHWLAREKEFRGEVDSITEQGEARSGGAWGQDPNSAKRKKEYATQSEVSAQWNFEIAGEAITFNARADRVDIMTDGFRLIDYKTGTPPSGKKIEEGEAKQLPLTALALMRSGTVKCTPNALIYWALKTREQSKDFVEINAAEELLQRTEAELFAMIAESLTEATSYAPEIISGLSDFQDEYEHLIRRDEWSN